MNSKLKFKINLLVALLLLGTFSCTSLRQKKALELLEPSVIKFYEQLKWFRASMAKTYILPAKRPQFLDDIDIASRKLKFSHIKVIRITPINKNSKAVVRLRVIWHTVDEAIVHETLVEEKWKLFKRVWLRTKSRVVSGEKLPWIFNK
jgi:hypothetical protein